MENWTDTVASRALYETGQEDRLEPVNCFSLANWENEGGAVPPPEPARAEQPAIAG